VRGIAIDLEKMVAEAVADKKDDRPARHPLASLAQAMELEARFKAACEEHTFAPGDLVRSKPGLGFLKTESVMMYWRALDLSDPTDFYMAKRFIKRTMVNRIDCVVAYLAEDGGTVLHVPAESALLEPYVEREPAVAKLMRGSEP
jgi:hypothetical protein